MELRPLRESDHALLSALEQQDDVWEYVGTLPVPGQSHHLFVVVEGATSLGIAGLVKSPVLGGEDFELLCAMRSEAQMQGYAKQACLLALEWAFDQAGLERVISCIDDANESARSIAAKLGMKELGPLPPNRTVYVVYRHEHRRGAASRSFAGRS